MAVINDVSYALVDRTIPADGTLVSMAEHFDQFILDWQMKHPTVWRDRIPMGQFPLFNGYSQKSYIFRGTLGPQAGIADWSPIEPSTRPAGTDTGFDRCTYNPQTYTWSYDAIDFTGFATSWRSPVFCVNDLKFQDKAQQQLGMIIKAGAQITDQVKETFNREMYVKTAADAGKFFVLAEGVSLGFIDSTTGRVTYNPATEDTNSNTYVEFPLALLPKISTLNFTQLDLVKQYLSDQCPEAAIANDGGMPVYGLMLDLMDFERFVLEDAQLREDFRYARPQQLISGFNMGFKVYRGWAVMHDPRQMRFSISSFQDETVRATRVLPRRATRAGIIGSIPETNPDYITAELGTAIVFMNNVIQILIPSVVNSLGTGMVFGPAPDFNGQWTWLNIQDEETNPLKEMGYFFSRYEYFVKALEYAQDVMVILYRRCTQTLKTSCSIEADADAGTSAFLATIPASGDFVAASGTVGGTLVATLAGLLEAGVGSKVTITNDAGADIAAYILEDQDAPTYKLGWVHDATNAPSAVTEVNLPGTMKVTVA